MLKLLQVVSDRQRSGPSTTNEPESEESPIVVYIQTQENRTLETGSEETAFPSIRYTDPLPSFQQGK